MASQRLTELARHYLKMVDTPDGYLSTDERSAERSNAHDAMMNAMTEEKMPFNSRYEARWIARWILAQNLGEDTITALPETRLMFLKARTTNGTPEIIYDMPPDDNKPGYMPVWIVVLPFTEQPFIAERNLA